ncbi:hypothetical protein [Micromonospora endolithica]|uniref:DUF748 domain-containing protein n=1 Tax=Micromonospora endolithica TaxID=230091 RepID=A0A3A9ZSF3_9ACTN|nr:hypothetical protein [Micromonospora endolithica]RKN50387.1 hypothetical protein D7223_00860 [Micromonospora endolithica]TWJ20936.1 hypothetical protein JD76_01036 [Micromonospora endolithica]
MNTATKLSGFTLGLATVFGAAYGVGHVADPVAPAAETRHDSTTGHDDAGHDTGSAAAEQIPGGLQVSDRGYTLAPITAPTDEFAFRITGPDGRPVTTFDEAHDKRMHLIVTRRDLSGFRHVHPEMAPDGTWRVASPLGEPGTWRAFADFTPTGAEPLTLGVDVPVPGPFTPRPLPAPAASSTIDGYTVTIAGTLQPGRTAELTLNVSRDGAPVTDLQPYLGAYGHLVALRQGDLAYLHVHPDGEPGDGRTQPGPQVTFFAEVPSAGTYRLFLDFQHQGTVRTAEFTLTAGDAPTSGGTAPAGPATPRPSATDGHGEPGHAHN